MLTNNNPSDKSKISKVTIDPDNLYIELSIKEGYIDDNSDFIHDGRPAVTLRIANIEDMSVEQVDVGLVVNANQEVTLTEVPIDNNQVIIDDIAQEHASGQTVVCASNVENDIVTVSYYYNQAGRGWFNEAASFIRDASFDGLNDYDYISKRLWTTAIEMGLVQGEVIT